jgi:hypothetical protein
MPAPFTLPLFLSLALFFDMHETNISIREKISYRGARMGAKWEINFKICCV